MSGAMLGLLTLISLCINFQGMCFSLPTLEDPFNDRHDKMAHVKKIKKPSHAKTGKTHVDEKLFTSGKGLIDRTSANVNVQGKTSEKPEKVNKVINPSAIFKSDGMNNMIKQGKSAITRLWGCQANREEELTGCPSKFLIHCLNTIQNAFRDEDGSSSEVDNPLFVHKWGFEFWKFYSTGKDILDLSGTDSTFQQIAWLASCAADTIAKKEKEGKSFSSPFLLFIVPSQAKAAKVCIFFLSFFFFFFAYLILVTHPNNL